jgi:hypothetical protein
MAGGYFRRPLYHQRETGRHQASLAPQKIAEAATAPSLPSSKKAIVQTLEKARKTGIPIPIPVVADAGVSFARASKADATAWPIAIDLINYRSYLNTFSIVIPVGVPVNQLTTQYSLADNPPGRARPQFSIPQIAVPKETSAILEPLGSQPDKDNPLGNAILLGTGGSMSLDEMHLRHVLLNGVEIHYSGRPLVMEDVVFLNCTFVMDNTEPSRELAQAIAVDANVKFSHA